MVRPIQPLGTFGLITVRRTKSGYVASTRFRELTGGYRRVSASAPTATTAENELKAKIAAGLPSTAEGDLNRQTKLTVVADVWLDEIEQRQEQAPQTIEVYRDIVRRIILPAVGELRLSERPPIGAGRDGGVDSQDVGRCRLRVTSQDRCGRRW